MTHIKLCGLSRPCDIEAANRLLPEYVGFVFAEKSRRCITPEHAGRLCRRLASEIKAVGVFVDEEPETVAGLLQQGTIHIAQLHGGEDERYIAKTRTLTDKPIIKAFRVDSAEDVSDAQRSSADYILLDSGSGGTGSVFDWTLLQNLTRPYFLAGGLCPENITSAVNALHPYAVDVSSGIETDGLKDFTKMAAFVSAVRKGF